MIFTSYTYLAFLIAAFFIHWTLPNALRKPFLLVASYVFYCSWDWRFGGLLLGVSLFNWSYGRFVVARTESGRALALGIVANLLPLLYFKYTSFFLESISWSARALGADLAMRPLSIVLPLGISFFTFQGIAYLVDVAAGEEPFEKPLDFLLYKAFWPQLVAGPIVRPGEIKDTITGDRAVSHEDLAEGARRILFGFFKKAVLADALAPVIDPVFATGARPHFIDACVGMFGFGAQIYLDFSAYSDIAIGSARLFGFEFPENFEAPYGSRSPQEFWNRWHMSLSRWIRDYVFTPLHFAARRRPWMSHVYLVFAMALCGFWHGAAFTFVLWGVWHGLLLVANQTILRGFFPRAGAATSRARSLVAWAMTTLLVMLGWVLFRAQSMAQAMDVYRAFFTLRGGFRPSIVRENGVLIAFCIVAAVVASPFVWEAWKKARARIDAMALAPRLARPVLYCVLAVLVVALHSDAKAFVYFQF